MGLAILDFLHVPELLLNLSALAHIAFVKLSGAVPQKQLLQM